uniref:Uncharacterized protein n=1 Tax=Plectus sambesii TaxID=2011161 RepID=A0A914UV62_9BILA
MTCDKSGAAPEGMIVKGRGRRCGDAAPAAKGCAVPKLATVHRAGSRRLIEISSMHVYKARAGRESAWLARSTLAPQVIKTTRASRLSPLAPAPYPPLPRSKLGLPSFFLSPDEPLCF